MGTAAMTLPAALLLLGTSTSFHSANGVGAAFDTTARVNAARFSAVGVGVMLPIFSAAIWRGRGRLRS